MKHQTTNVSEVRDVKMKRNRESQKAQQTRGLSTKLVARDGGEWRSITLAGQERVGRLVEYRYGGFEIRKERCCNAG